MNENEYREIGTKMLQSLVSMCGGTKVILCAFSVLFVVVFVYMPETFSLTSGAIVAICLFGAVAAGIAEGVLKRTAEELHEIGEREILNEERRLMSDGVE